MSIPFGNENDGDTRNKSENCPEGNIVFGLGMGIAFVDKQPVKNNKQQQEAKTDYPNLLDMF
jgi:hypothetical protein